MGQVAFPTLDPTQKFCYSLHRYYRAFNFTNTYGFLIVHLEQTISLFTERKTYHTGHLQNQQSCYHHYLCMFQYMLILIRPLRKTLP